MSLYQNITQTIGNTPLIRLNRVEEALSLNAKLYAKIEFFNPGSSVKDRIAYAMITDAKTRGVLQPGQIIIEATSGNTGIGLAMVGAALGHPVILCMPETLSIERRKILIAYGAKLYLTEGPLGMKGAIAKAEQLHQEIQGSFMPRQFDNQANPTIHYHTTGPEIWKDTNESVDIFVAGVGTGGTITGVGTFLKEKNPNIRVIAVEPKDSPMLSKGTSGPHKIQGIGAGFVPNILNRSVINEIVTISNEEAYEFAKFLPKTEGIFVGISSGAALKAAIDEAKKPQNNGKTIVVLLPDTGERYLSNFE